MIKNGEVDFIINTPSADRSPRVDEITIRSTAVANAVPVMTNLRAAQASVMAIKSLRKGDMEVSPLQDYHP